MSNWDIQDGSPGGNDYIISCWDMIGMEYTSEGNFGHNFNFMLGLIFTMVSNDSAQFYATMTGLNQTN